MRSLLVVSAVALVAFLAVFAFAVGTEPGQRADEAALAGGADVPATAQAAANRLLRVVSIGTLAAAIIVLSAFAWLRRRPGLLLIPAAVIGASLVATELLKHVILDRPDLVAEPVVTGNSYPSGHTTVAVSIGMAAVLIAGPRWRRAVAFAAAVLAAAAGVFVVTAEWHRPSDAVGSYLLTLAVAAACMAGLRAWRPEQSTAVHRLGDAWDTEARPGIGLELVAFAAGAAVFTGAIVLASLRYGSDIDWTRLHAAYLLATAAIVTVAGLCVAALLRALEP